jgi:Cysteine-rich secretory protein family
MKKFGPWLKKVFIPHEANGHRPSVLRAKTIVPVLITIVIIQTVFFFGSSYLVPHSRLFGLIEVNALTDGTNAARTDGHMPALSVSPLLQAAAQGKANDMVASDYFAHTSPAGITPWYWFVNIGYHFSYAGENLAVNFSESQDVTAAWLASAEHRANILDPHFTEIGIAVAQGNFEGRPATYVVEFFGTPAAVAPAPAVAANAPAHPAGVGVAIKPTPAAPRIPIIIATSSRTTTGSEQMFVAVKGAETAATPTTGTGNAPAAGQPIARAQTSTVATAQSAVAPPAVSPVAPPAVSIVEPKSSVLDRALANPAHTMNYLYYLILFFFAFALGLDIFVKIRVQHPDLILGGLIAISVAGLFIIINQHYFLGAVIR